MPRTHTDEGLRAARTIRALGEVRILVLSQFAQPSYALEPARGRDRRDRLHAQDRVSDLAALADGVRRVAAGESVLVPSVVAQLVGRPRRGRDRSRS
jgi:DNA-binding NarL/FixJ family response regulator